MKNSSLDKKSIEIRRKIIDIIITSRRGHITSAFSSVEIIRTLYEQVLKVNPKKPLWTDRDRFILSKGHACLSHYVILSQKGFFPTSKLTTFCKRDSILGGHPQYGKVPGVEASTGSLGHGFSIAVGIATSAKIDKKKFKAFVLLSDGECDEGSTWEAALHASKHRLDNLVVLIDYNKIQSYGTTTEVLDLEPFAQKWKSFGFDTQEVDGHNMSEIKKALRIALSNLRKPHVIICHTVKGKGIPAIENDPSWHHKSKISDEEINMLTKSLTDH